MARIRWGRVIVAAIAAEVGVILTLLVISAVFHVASERAGYYVAPPASALATFLMVLWVGRRLESGFILHGVLVGVCGVILTAGFLFGAKPEDRLMYAVSFVLRIMAGYLGGLMARRPATMREAQLQ
jgi:hypothetical protein